MLCDYIFVFIITCDIFYHLLYISNLPLSFCSFFFTHHDARHFCTLVIDKSLPRNLTYLFPKNITFFILNCVFIWIGPFCNFRYRLSNTICTFSSYWILKITSHTHEIYRSSLNIPWRSWRRFNRKLYFPALDVSLEYFFLLRTLLGNEEKM